LAKALPLLLFAHAGWRSQYVHKDRSRRLKVCPVWDWDAAFGNLFFGHDEETPIPLAEHAAPDRKDRQ